MSQPPPIALTMSPKNSFEPSTITLTLRIPRDVLNRSVDLILEGPNYYSASSFSHLPDAPSLLMFRRPDVPAGDYTATAYLHLSTGKTLRSLTSSMTVLGRY